MGGWRALGVEEFGPDPGSPRISPANATVTLSLRKRVNIAVLTLVMLAPIPRLLVICLMMPLTESADPWTIRPHTKPVSAIVTFAESTNLPMSPNKVFKSVKPASI